MQFQIKDILKNVFTLTPCSCASDGSSGSLTPGGARKADLYSSRRFTAMSEGLRPLGKKEGGREGEKEEAVMYNTYALFSFQDSLHSITLIHTTYFIMSLPSSPVSSMNG